MNDDISYPIEIRPYMNEQAVLTAQAANAFVERLEWIGISTDLIQLMPHDGGVIVQVVTDDNGKGIIADIYEGIDVHLSEWLAVSMDGNAPDKFKEDDDYTMSLYFYVEGFD